MDENEWMRRAWDLLDELRLADFMPEELHGEYDALRAARPSTIRG